MEFIKRHTKIMVKDDTGRIVQIIPETEAASVMVEGVPLSTVLSTISSGKADANHGHVIGDVTLLQTTLDDKHPLMDEIENEEILDLLNT